MSVSRAPSACSCLCSIGSLSSWVRPPSTAARLTHVRRAKLSDSQVEELFHAEASHPCYIVCASALLNLWKESDDWLRRLRRCAYPKCDTPYFLDRTTARRSRFCGSKHRQYDRRRRLKET